MELEGYLLATRDHWAAYHNHKEQMAYGAATLYLAFVAAVAIKPATIWMPGIRRTQFLSALLVVASTSLSFALWQLRKREFAADVVKACGNLLTRALGGGLTDSDRAPAVHGEHEMPQFLVSEILTIRQPFQGPRFSAVLTYLLMLGGTVVAVCRMWQFT